MTEIYLSNGVCVGIGDTILTEVGGIEIEGEILRIGINPRFGIYVLLLMGDGWTETFYLEGTQN